MSIITQIKLKTPPLRFKILNSRKVPYLVLKPLYKFSLFSLQFTFNRLYRNDKLTKMRYGRHVLQANSCTAYNRYSDLFIICQQYFLTKEKPPKILSFGCSTGDEVASLHQYLPEAQLVGVDINRYNLKVCQQRFAPSIQKNSVEINLPGPIFMHSLAAEYLNSGDYDAILCLAVLQHPNNRQIDRKSATKFTFKQFEQQIIQFDNKLKTRGLLLIDHCDFNFLESSVANRYQILGVADNYLPRNRPLYNQLNQRCYDISIQPRVFIKLA